MDRLWDDGKYEIYRTYSPEPTALALLAAGLGGAALLRRRGRRKRPEPLPAPTDGA